MSTKKLIVLWVALLAMLGTLAAAGPATASGHHHRHRHHSQHHHSHHQGFAIRW